MTRLLSGLSALLLPRGLAVAAGVENLAGSGPEGWPGFTGRNLYLSLSWSAEGR